MKMSVQVFTEKGFYGPQQDVRISTVADTSGKIVTTLEKLPDELEGEKLVDWTRIVIEIVRD